MKNVTNEYVNMLEALECDLYLMWCDPEKYVPKFTRLFTEKNEKVKEDIRKLGRLRFDLVSNRARIIEPTEDTFK